MVPASALAIPEVMQGSLQIPVLSPYRIPARPGDTVFADGDTFDKDTGEREELKIHGR